MHAGDGNVHTNIPVNSDNYAMLQTANARGGSASWRSLASLDGVISGEHGIGITKLEFLTETETADFRAYKVRVDPRGRFNKGKLLPGRATCVDAYTPSFDLLGHESLIMQQSDIGAISEPIKDCLRCGKCKPVCATHVPRANLLYSPAQQDPRHLTADRSVPVRGADAARRFDPALGRVRRRRRPLHRLPQVRDALSGGHRLRRRVDGDARPAAPHGQEALQSGGSGRGMFFLNATNPETIKLARKVMIDWGYRAQRLANRACFGLLHGRRPGDRRPPRAEPPMQ